MPGHGHPVGLVSLRASTFPRMRDYYVSLCSYYELCGNFSEDGMRCTVGCSFDVCRQCATLDDSKLELPGLGVRRPSLSTQLICSRLLLRSCPSSLFQVQLRGAAKDGEADVVAELLRRDDAAKFIDRAGPVRRGVVWRWGDALEAQGGRVTGSVALWLVTLTPGAKGE